MRHVCVVILVTVFLLSGWGVVVSRGQVIETEPERLTTIAMDLMDMEIPGEGAGDKIELPPIQGGGRREVEPAPPADSQKPPKVAGSMSERPEVSRSVASPGPGMVPFLLEEPGLERGASRPGTDPTMERAPATLDEEFPAELKTVPPPPSRAESLKLPSGMDMRASDGSEVPEIPLLKGEDMGRQAPLGQDSSLTMKPFPDLSGTPGPSRGARPSQTSRRPEEYLQVREDIDARLIDLYERYYKDR